MSRWAMRDSSSRIRTSSARQSASTAHTVNNAGGRIRHAILGDHPGSVDLEQETGGHDGLIFLPHCLGDGEEICLVRRVVFVPALQLVGAGRHRRYESLLGVY